MFDVLTVLVLPSLILCLSVVWLTKTRRIQAHLEKERRHAHLRWTGEQHRPRVGEP